MPVPASLEALSTTAASNPPAGSEPVAPLLDDHLRFGYSALARLRDEKAAKGSNSDITALTALASVPTVVTTAINARAAAGANSDITALSALASVPTVVAAAINAAAVPSVPSGAVFHFALATAPTGYLVCDGSAVSRTTYAALFAAIGTLFGAGNGSTTFNLPDLRGEFIRGVDSGRGADPGRALGSSQSSYAGSFWVSAAQDDGDGQGGSFKSVTSIDFNGQVSVVNGVGSGTVTVNPGDTRPRNVALLPCIKT